MNIIFVDDCPKCNEEYDEDLLLNNICWKCLTYDIKNFIVERYDKFPKMNVKLYQTFFDEKTSKSIYDILEKNLKWNKVKRSSYTFGTEDYNIKFGGYANKPEKIVKKTVINWNKCPILLYIKNLLEKELGKEFKFCVIQRYPNGNFDMYKHCDRIIGSIFTIICGLSFGETRTMRVSHSNKYYDFELTNGSLYILIHPTNEYWKHEILKDVSKKNCRYSLTYRG